MGSGECTCTVAETDVAIGGAFKICIQGEGDHWAHGHYREIDPLNRLVFSCSENRRMARWGMKY